MTEIEGAALIAKTLEEAEGEPLKLISMAWMTISPGHARLHRLTDRLFLAGVHLEPVGGAKGLLQVDTAIYPMASKKDLHTTAATLEEGKAVVEKFLAERGYAILKRDIWLPH